MGGSAHHPERGRLALCAQRSVGGQQNLILAPAGEGGGIRAFLSRPPSKADLTLAVHRVAQGDP